MNKWIGVYHGTFIGPVKIEVLPTFLKTIRLQGQICANEGFLGRILLILLCLSNLFIPLLKFGRFR